MGNGGGKRLLTADLGPWRQRWQLVGHSPPIATSEIILRSGMIRLFFFMTKYGDEVDSLIVEVAANVLRKPHKAKEDSVFTYRSFCSML